MHHLTLTLTLTLTLNLIRITGVYLTLHFDWYYELAKAPRVPDPHPVPSLVRLLAWPLLYTLLYTNDGYAYVYVHAFV